MPSFKRAAALLLAGVLAIPVYAVNADETMFAIIDYSFDEPSDTLWGFTKTGSGFDISHAVSDGNGMIQFKGGNGTGSPGIAQLDIPSSDMGDYFEVSFDVYHPLSDAGDTFIRFTDDNDKDIFSFYIRESGDAADIAGKTMRYGLNTVLGSNSLGTSSNGSAKLLSTPETGNVGPNGITYNVRSTMDFSTKKQSLVITNKETNEVVTEINDADIKNAVSLDNIKIGYGYIVSDYEGVYIDNLTILTDPDEDILVNEFEMSRGAVKAEIMNLSGRDMDVIVGCGVHKNDGTLRYLNYRNETISAKNGENVYMFTDNIEFEEGDKNEVELYVWDAETMTPLSEKLAVTDTGNEYNIAAMVGVVPKENQLLDEGYYTWCGSYIKGDDGRYHVFYSRWKLEYGFVPGWVSHSEIAHAVSDNINGPYVFEDVVIGPRGREYWDGTTAHNPYIIEKDDKYYLYYMGTTAPEGTAETPSSYSGDWYEYRNRQQIGVAVSDSLDGPWERFDTPVHSPDTTLNDDGTTKWDSMLVTNPAVTVMPDGRILMTYKGVQDTTNGDTSKKNGAVKMGAAVADDPLGPFEKQGGLIFEGKESHAAEDPFLWYSNRNEKYYAVVRDPSAEFTGISNAMALFESEDGINDWKPSKYPLVLTNYITWDDGTRNNSPVERPWLLFDENEDPIMLCGATRINNNESFTTNIRIPLSSD